MSLTIREESFAAFESQYQLIPNHLTGIGQMFETYGPEYEFVRSQAPDSIWTLIQGDTDSKLWVVAGFHFVNRLGYFITTEAHKSENEEYLLDEFAGDDVDDLVCGHCSRLLSATDAVSSCVGDSHEECRSTCETCN